MDLANETPATYLFFRLRRNWGKYGNVATWRSNRCAFLRSQPWRETQGLRPLSQAPDHFLLLLLGRNYWRRYEDFSLSIDWGKIGGRSSSPHLKSNRNFSIGCEKNSRKRSRSLSSVFFLSPGSQRSKVNFRLFEAIELSPFLGIVSKILQNKQTTIRRMISVCVTSLKL